VDTPEHTFYRGRTRISSPSLPELRQAIRAPLMEALLRRIEQALETPRPLELAALRQEIGQLLDPTTRRLLPVATPACACGPVRHWECNAGCKAAQAAGRVA
jgi:hypothetical protein